MRKLCRVFLASTLWLPVLVRAADDAGPMISLPVAPVAPKSAPARRRDASTDRASRVVAWIRQQVPSCPADAAAAAGRAFVDELEEQDAALADRLNDPAFPFSNYESAMLRHVAAHLPAAGFDSVREELAKRRATAVGKLRNLGAVSVQTLLSSLKTLSETRYRSLLDGRMEDDDLAFYLKRTGEKTAATPAETARPAGGGSAADIVAEFSRRNQKGAALRQWRAFLMEATLKPASGNEQQIVIAKMRPDRFRLSVVVGGTLRFVQANDGRQFWQQVAGGSPQVLSAAAMGTRRYLAEFADPLFGEEGYSFERLSDGGSGDSRYYRISVARPDGSKYVAQIDARSWQEIGREEPDGSRARYSDFREISGVMFAFHEEAVDAAGRKAEVRVTRIVANPGLIAEFFVEPTKGDQTYFTLDHFLPRVAATTANPQP